MTGRHAWIALVVGIVVYELNSKPGELMSEVADRWIEQHPILSRIVIGLTGAVITLHLGNFIPQKYDAMNKELWEEILSWAR